MNKIILFMKSNKILSGNLMGTFLFKGLAIVLSVFTTSAYFAYFKDSTVLGIWFTILSIMSWMFTFDAGLGAGLRNKLVEPLFRKDYRTAKQLIASTYVPLILLSLLEIIIGVLIIISIDVNKVMNVSLEILPASRLRTAMLVVFIGFVSELSLRTVNGIIYALQKAKVVGGLALLSNILIYVYLIFAPNIGDVSERLICLAFVYVLSQILPLIITTFVIFAKPLKKCIPGVRDFDYNVSKSLIGLGGQFFFIQLCLIVINSTNQWLISYLFSPASVSEYQVYFKLFNVAVMFFSLITQTVWSAVTQEYHKGNFEWIRKIGRYLKIASALFAICCFAIVPFLEIIFQLWLGIDAIQSNIIYGLCFALLTSIELFIYADTCIANGLSKLKCQTICYFVAAFVKIPIALILKNIYPDWTAVILAQALSLIPLAIFQPIINHKYCNKDLYTENNI